MGCGCKEKTKIGNIPLQNENGELNLAGKIYKIPIAILLTLIFIIVSPFIVGLIWYMAIKSLFGKENNLVKLMLIDKFKKKDKDYVEDEYIEDDEFNEENYELLDVDDYYRK